MNQERITIAVLLGTTRENRRSINAARYVAEQGRTFENVDIIFVDPSEFNFPHDGNDEPNKDPRYGEIISRADAFFIVTPEYNHSFPGSLKRMLDSEYAAYFHKPVALAGVSNGPWGGVRVCEALLPVCHRLGLINIQPEVYFPKVQEIFDSSGAILEQYRQMYEQNVDKSYAELVWLARAIKAAQHDQV